MKQSKNTKQQADAGQSQAAESIKAKDADTAKVEVWASRNALVWLLVAQAFTIFPLFIYLPLWVPPVWLFVLYWRIQIYRGAWQFPGSKIKGVLGAGIFIALISQYMGNIGVEPLVALLVSAFILKLLEVRSRSDVLLILYVGFIATAAQFLFFQTIFIAFYGLCSVLLLLCAWNAIYRTNPLTTAKQIRVGGILLIQSVPLMLVLFLVVPRIGSLWQVPIPQSTGQTGFSDTMSPGDFTELSKSDAVAFRVTFENSSQNKDFPPREHWYWRGLVLDTFDGRTWKYDKANVFKRNQKAHRVPEFWEAEVKQDADIFRYQILMEPHQQRWLFSLMLPLSAKSGGPGLWFTSDYLLKSPQPVAARMQYEVASSLDYRAGYKDLNAYQRRFYLQLPQNTNPRARALARSWLDKNLSHAQILERVLNRYRESFTYTLRPPPLGSNSIDEFMFITQKGFCEHFSSSFVFLMRAAGIPARVVVGYQGGEVHPEDNYLIVRQKDAHAWAEIWLPGRGWVRVDPTAAVSPLRIERGLNESLGEEDARLIKPLFTAAWFNNLQLKIDAISFSWHRWVLGYDDSRQQGLFASLLGGTEAWRIGAFFILSLGGAMLLYFIVLTRKGSVEYSFPEEVTYQILLKKLQVLNESPMVQESPHAFCLRVAESQPSLRGELLNISAVFEKLMYAEERVELQRLNNLVKDLKVTV